MEILAIFISSKLCIKVISEINIDIVNPIPAINEAKNISINVKSFGFSVIKQIQPSMLNKVIPTGFPMQSPSIIPFDRVVALEKSIVEKLRLIPVLANANKGIIIRLFIGVNIDCNFSRGDTLL